MHEYLPILILGAIIGVFTTIFLVVYALEKNKKETMGFERHMADGEIIKRLLKYAKPYTKSFIVVFLLMIVSIAHEIISPLITGEIVKQVRNKKVIVSKYKAKKGYRRKNGHRQPYTRVLIKAINA